MNFKIRAFCSRDSVFAKNSTLGLICLGMFFFIACGRRTPPRPAKPQVSFNQLGIIQYGDNLRLSWVMQKDIPKETGIQRFQIEETQLDPQCLHCQPEMLSPRIFPFPSEQFIFDGKRVYLSLSTNKDLKVHTYRVTHQDDEGDPLSPSQVVNFTKFVEFPPVPALQWAVLPKGTLPNLDQLPRKIPPQAKEIRFLRLSWPQQQEKIEFYFSNQGNVAQRTRFYRINIYKTPIGKPWSERPINGQPIAETFYIDYQLKTKHAFLYQIRLVDSQGNESPPSSTYTISPQS